MRSCFALVIAALSLAIPLVSSFGCSEAKESPAPLCIDAGIDPACTPAYEPSWEALYTNTLKPGCAFSGVSCHNASGRQGDLDFGDIDAAYADLMRGKVVAGKPECGSLVQRLVSTDKNLRMPPAKPLSAGEQCAVVQWIAAGAHR